MAGNPAYLEHCSESQVTLNREMEAYLSRKKATDRLKAAGYYFDGDLCWHESQPESTKVNYKHLATV
jgi:hypothetical protein